jgi:hypothetical protein
MAGRVNWPAGHFVVRISVDLQRLFVRLTDECGRLAITAPLDLQMTKALHGRSSAYFVACLRGPQVAILQNPGGKPREVSGW